MKEFRNWKELGLEGPVSVVVDDEEMRNILGFCGNRVDKEGFITDRSGEREEANDSGPIKLSEIGAVCPGSKVFIRKDIAAYSHYLATKR